VYHKLIASACYSVLAPGVFRS